MTTNRPLVSLVDDDDSVRESLPDLLREYGFDVQAFASGEAFLASPAIYATRCLVLDVAMPGMSGLDLLHEIRRQGRSTPIVFITAHADEQLCAQLLAAGAIACLFKPFSGSALVNAVRSALESNK